jgi:tRNA(adenine34) deaminase
MKPDPAGQVKIQHNLGPVMADAHDEYFMGLALKEARKAQAEGEVPVGAVLVDDDRCLLARGRNQTIARSDPTAHAEITAIRKAGRKRSNYRLLSTTLYVTVEPCFMCMGAIIHARIARLVFGAHDPKWGAAGSLYDFAHDHRLNHQPEIVAGVCGEDCRALMRGFFKQKRGLSKRSFQWPIS